MHDAKLLRGVCNLSEMYGFIVLILIHGGLALWVYNDIKLRERSMLWILGILLVPEAFFPLYFWNQAPELVWTCHDCHRNNRVTSRQCKYCNRTYTVDETASKLHGYFEPSDPIVIILVALLIHRFALYTAIGIANGPEKMMQPQDIASYISTLPLSHFWIVEVIVGNILIWLCLHCVTMRYRRPLAAVGLRFSGDLRIFGLAFLLAPVLMLISEGGMQVIVGLNHILSSKALESLVQMEQQQQALGMPEHIGDASVILMGFVALILTPVGEEMLYRGITYTALSNRFGNQKGLLLSSLLFALLHGSVLRFIPLFVMGLVLALLSVRTKSIIPGIITHSFVNLISIVVWFR